MISSKFQELFTSLRSTYDPEKMDDILDELFLMGSDILPELYKEMQNKNNETRVICVLMDLIAALDPYYKPYDGKIGDEDYE